MIKKRGALFYVDARRYAGAQRRFTTKEEAEGYLEQVRSAHVAGSVYVDPTHSLKVGQAIEEYLVNEEVRARAEQLAASYVQNKAIALRQLAGLGSPSLGSRRVGELRKSDLVRLLPLLQKACKSHSTLKKKWVILGQFFEWLVDTDQIDSNPARIRLPRRTDEPKETLRISRDKIAQIIAHAGERHRLVIQFSAYTGLRAGEQRALTWNDLDLDAGVVRVTRAVKHGGYVGPPKTAGGKRTVPLAPDLIAELRAWKLAQPIEQRRQGLVFPTAKGGIADINNWRNRGLHKACKAAGVDLIRWHDLRHYFASVLLFEMHEGEATITALLGHNSIAFTFSQYGHWLVDAKRDRDLGARLGAALGGGRYEQ
jgi:integrase